MKPFVLAACLALACVASASADDTRTAIIAAQQAQKARILKPEVPPASDRVLRRIQRIFALTAPAIAPTFGGVRPGSGFAPGVAFLAPAGRGRLTARAMWSIENTKRIETSLRVPPEVAGATLMLEAYWEDAPRTNWFGPGMHSTTRQEYGLTARGVTARADMAVRERFHLGGSLGYLGTDATPIGESSWVEATASAAFDTRTSPGYTRSGALYAVRFGHLAARTAGQSAFERVTMDARHFVPLLHENWVVAVQARVDLTLNADCAPFFLLPYLGGGSSLRGYGEYRFVDRQTVLLRGELRWIASRALDVAAFVDAGVVAPTIDRFRLADRAQGWGVGARFHGYRSTGFRIDVAHGAEGWHLHLAQSASF